MAELVDAADLKSADCKVIPVRLWVFAPNATFVQWLVQNLAKVWMRVQFSQVAPVLKCVQQIIYNTT